MQEKFLKKLVVSTTVVHFGVDKFVLNRFPGIQIGKIVLRLHLKMIERPNKLCLYRLPLLEFKPKLPNESPLRIRKQRRNSVHCRQLECRLPSFPLALLEKRYITNFSLSYIVHDCHCQHALQCDWLLQPSIR